MHLLPIHLQLWAFILDYTYLLTCTLRSLGTRTRRSSPPFCILQQLIKHSAHWLALDLQTTWFDLAVRAGLQHRLPEL